MGKHSHLSLTSLAALGGGKIKADVRAKLEATAMFGGKLRKPAPPEIRKLLQKANAGEKLSKADYKTLNAYYKGFERQGVSRTESLGETQVFIRSKGDSDWRKPKGAITLVDKKTGKTVGQHFRTSDEAKKYAERNKMKVVKEGKADHKLIIKSLHDAQATCSCGHWNFSATGSRTKQDIAKEWKKHVKGVKESLEEGNLPSTAYPVKLKAGMPEIKHGDKVTILVPAGKGRAGQEWAEKTGKAVMKSPKVGGWALNMGGAHGRPGLASPKNIVAVNGKRVIKESLEEGERDIEKKMIQQGKHFKVNLPKGKGKPMYTASFNAAKEMAKEYGKGAKVVDLSKKESLEEGTGEEIMKAPGTGTSVAAKTQGYIKSIVDKRPQTAAELEKLLRDVPHDFLDGVKKEVQKRTRLSFKEAEVEGLVRRKSSFQQHCKACGIDIHPGSYFFEIGFHREYGVICNSCELDGKKVVLDGLMKIDKIMVATEASKSGMHELTKDGKSLFKGTYNACLTKLQRVSPHSWNHSLKYEGYKIKPIKESEELTEATLKAVCPACKKEASFSTEISPLKSFRGGIGTCSKCGAKYKIKDGKPWGTRIRD